MYNWLLIFKRLTSFVITCTNMFTHCREMSSTSPALPAPATSSAAASADGAVHEEVSNYYSKVRVRAD